MDCGSKMVHFRTLDWGMPALRRVIVHLDYISEPDGPVIASSITYAGYVGVLTGVRKDLSMSLNFRPNRIDNGKFWADAKYAWHLFLVLFGWRPSISTTLRQFLLHHRERRRFVSWLPFGRAGEMITLSYSNIVQKIRGEAGKKPIISTACYLCFCNGRETTVIEKDRISAKVRTSPEFIVVTNTDDASTDTTTATQHDKEESPFAAALQEIVHEAKDRQQCAWNNWSNMRYAKSQRLGFHIISDEDLQTLSEVDDVIELVGAEVSHHE